MKVKLIIYKLSILFLLGALHVYGQNPIPLDFNIKSLNHHFNTEFRPNDSLNRKAKISVANFNYFRNYEYSNKFHDGYTLYGSQLETQIHYFAHPNLLLSTGFYARKDFGEDGIYEFLPLLRLTYAKNDFTLLFGNIESNASHGYLEPLYNLEYKITEPINYGTQVKLNKPGYKLDAWVSWQKMIYPKDKSKEEILGGLLFEPALLKNSRNQLSLPLQFMAYHKGGQIDVIKDVPMATWTNTALGIKYQHLLAGRIKRLFTENYALFFNDHSPQKQLAFQSGKGMLLNLGLNATWGNIHASYWRANGFLSFRGMPLYTSVSNTVHDAGYTEKQKELLLFQYIYQKELIPNFFLDLRFEPFFDLRNSSKNLQFNHSIFLSYKTNFNLYKTK